jgi:hypothetical protein
MLRRTLLVNGIATGMTGLLAPVASPWLSVVAVVLVFAILEVRGIAKLASA